MNLEPFLYLIIGIGCIFIYRLLKKDGLANSIFPAIASST